MGARAGVPGAVFQDKSLSKKTEPGGGSVKEWRSVKNEQ
jgi:hypothetical protein